MTGTFLAASRDGAVPLANQERGVTRGQTAVARRSDIHFVSLDSPSPPAPPRALLAVCEADAVTIGPGSLDTSVLA